MKNTIFYLTFICSLFILSMIGCEKSTDQSTTKNAMREDMLNTRAIEECADCPNGSDCCCVIQLVSTDNPLSLTLCGTTDGNTTCSTSAPSPCSSITGGGQSKTLSSLDTKLLFCLAPGNSLAVTNNNTSGIAIITITCQHDITNPQTVLDTIPFGFTHFYLTNGSCVTSECIH
jgi:hypothetical protein